jgi:ABC-2 type transport system permease protein
VAAVAVAAFGLVPRAAVAGSWTVFGVVLAVDLFGQVLQLPGWLVGVSPFSHVPRLPGVPLDPALAPLAWLVLAAVVLAAAGLGGLRTRDVG